MSRPPAAATGFAGVVLAAGRSSRMGRSKAALEIGGATFLARCVRAAADAGLHPIVVVLRERGGEVEAALPAEIAVEIAVNRDADRGQLSSLQVALRRLLATPAPPRGAVIALVDHPLVTAATIASLARALGDLPPAGTRARIAVPVYAGRRGHPVAYRREVWSELLDAPDAGGARPVVRRDPARVLEVPVAEPAVLDDVDTPEDYARLAALRGSTGGARRAR